ncbi:hypothetical protein KFL_000650300 [Klebsormidium nitens]|uniref:Uncharacterized protein n=1 Tax=Klebsormidium nitens TaxID=105231 RepID=A0A1Y1HWJ4_KLENI|nr:hypothetical protein KFL_000650300 [Klebsormidium nitens]|eukprot:GAQ80897.1 hypothetical protein KFL_000650300 [Klebsormidium nitens]
MDGDNGRRGRPPPVTCSKSGCGGRANQSCVGVLCSACCRSAGNKCKAHAVRAPPKPKTPESLLLRSPFDVSTLSRPQNRPEHEEVGRLGPLRVPDAKAPGTPKREPVLGMKALLVHTGDVGRAFLGDHGAGARLEGTPQMRNAEYSGATSAEAEKIKVKGGGGEQAEILQKREGDEMERMQVEAVTAGLAGELEKGPMGLLGIASLRQRANNDALPVALATDAQGFGPGKQSVPREEASNTADDSLEQVGLSHAEMQALWNEDEGDGGSLMTQNRGEGVYATPDSSLQSEPFSSRGMPLPEPLPGFSGTLFGGQKGRSVGHVESPQSSAAEQELFQRISSQRSPFTAPLRPSSALLRETHGPGFTPELASAAFAAQLGSRNPQTNPPPTSGGGAEFDRQLAETLTPGRAAAFASGIGGAGGVRTGDPSRGPQIPWAGPTTRSPSLQASTGASALTPPSGLLERYHLDFQKSAPLKQAFAFPQLNPDSLSLSSSLRSSSAEPSPTSLDRNSGFADPAMSPGLERSSPWPLSPLGEALLPQPLPSGPLSSANPRTSSFAEFPLRGGRSEGLPTSPPLTYPLGRTFGQLGRGWTGGFGSEKTEQTGPATKRMRLSSAPLTRPADAQPLSPPKPKTWELPPAPEPMSPAYSTWPSSGGSGLPRVPSSIPSVPVLVSLAPESLPPASIPILVMQLQALHETVPLHLQAQVLASNRPLRILADAIEAHRMGTAGAGSDGGKGSAAGQGDPAPQASPRTRQFDGGGNEGSVQTTGTTPGPGKNSGREKRNSEGKNRGAAGPSVEAPGGPPRVLKQEGSDGTPAAELRKLVRAETGEVARQSGALLQGSAESKRELALRHGTGALGAAFALPQGNIESGLDRGSSPRNEVPVTEGFELAKDAVKVEGGSVVSEIKTLAVNKEKLANRSLPDIDLEEAAEWQSGQVDGGPALAFKGLPSVRDSEVQWSSAVGRKPELDEGSAVTTEESAVGRAKDRLRATTQLMQHLLPAPPSPAMGGASLQDREYSVYLTARDTLQEAATWAAPRGGDDEQPGSKEVGSTHEGGATQGESKEVPQAAVLGGAEEDAPDDEELAARVDDLRRHLQRLEDAPAGVEVLQQILHFDQAQTAGVGLTDEQVQRRASSLQRKTAPGLPTSVGPPEKRKPHKDL